ncbi:MAG: hypothetical protein ABJE95_16060 [Byssovorax sp.]
MLVVKIRFKFDDPEDWREIRAGERAVTALESDFPAYVRFEGRSARAIEENKIKATGGIVLESAAGGIFRWNPFKHDGEIAYGSIRLRLDVPDGGEFFVQVKPGRLSEDLWAILFEQVQAAADALITQWQESEKPHIERDRNRAATKFSPAAAEMEISKSWAAIEGALRRIARRPRTEIGPPRPGRAPCSPDHLPEPVGSADIYENRVVAAASRKLALLLQVIAERAEHSYIANVDRASALHGAGAMAIADANRRVDQAARVAKINRERLQTLNRLRRDLPDVQSLAVNIPHVTAKIRRQPDYYTIARLCAHLGREKYARWGRDFSVLATRRASDIYEYWCVFALCSAFVRLGYRIDLSHVAELVREDLFELEIRRDRPIGFSSSDGTERLLIWYDRQATFLPREGDNRPMKRAIWDDMWRAGGPTKSGLYAYEAASPDFWFELRSPGGMAVAVGDAIFDSVSEGTSDVIKKGQRVQQKYVRNLILVDDAGRSHRPIERGLVVFCGDENALSQVEEDDHEDSAIFLPLCPISAVGSQDGGAASILVSDVAVRRLEAFVSQMRSTVS